MVIYGLKCKIMEVVLVEISNFNLKVLRNCLRNMKLLIIIKGKIKKE
jgi:hypothetical protein